MRKCFFAKTRDLIAECTFQTCIAATCAGSAKTRRFIYADKGTSGPGVPDAEKEKTEAKTEPSEAGKTPPPEDNKTPSTEPEKKPSTAPTKPAKSPSPESKTSPESEAETSGTKQPTPDDVIKDIGKMRMETHGGIAAALHQVENAMMRPETSENKKLKERFARGQKQLNDLVKLEKRNDEDTEKKISALLNPLIEAKKIPQKWADIIVTHEFESFPPHAAKTRQDFEVLTQGLTAEEDRKIIEQIRRLKEEQAERTAKINEEAVRIRREFSNAITEAGQAITNKMDRERTIRNFTTETGIEVRAGQQLRYIDKQNGPQEATISEIHFMGSEEPTIFIEFKKKSGGKISDQTITEAVSPASFSKWVEECAVTEKINTLDQLEKTLMTKDQLESKIHRKIEKGQKLEFEILLDPTDASKTQHMETTIQEINEGAGTIQIDTPVKTDPHAEPKTILTFGEFAKWHKRLEVIKTIENVEELRNELLAFNEYLNVRDERNPAHYPALEIKDNEALKYNDGTGRTFVIKEVKDKNIILACADGDHPISFAAFLRWVKKNEVQKKAAKSEAALATENSEDPEEIAKAQEEAEEEIKKDQEEANKPPPKAGTPGRNLGSKDDSAQHSVSYFRKVWTETRLISAHNLGLMGKTFIEFIKRKMQRREHYAVGVIGERMFGPFSEQLGDEFRSLGKHAENEEVDLHAKHNRTIGVPEIKEDLHITTNRERIKAAIIVLCEKGQMRWDDPIFHHNFNETIKKYGVVHKDGQPVWINAANHLEGIETYLDEWFGGDTFRDLRNKNDSAYKNIRGSFEEQAGRLEADPEKSGGLKGALQKLLYRHIHGEYVNPAQYEEYLHFAIKKGKLLFEDKVYFLIMGLGMQGPPEHGYDGQTLLHIDRLGALEDEFNNNFPVLDYFTAKNFTQYDTDGNPILDENGSPKIGKISAKHFKDWSKKITEGGLEKAKSYQQLDFNKDLRDMVTKDMLWSRGFRVRLRKSVKFAGNWDHDDMDYHVPFLNEILVEQIAKRQGGATMNVSAPGLINALVGFNNFVNMTHGMLEDDMQSGNEELLERDTEGISNMILSFTKLDSILMNRYKKNNDSFGRLSDEDYDEIADADSSRKVKEHVAELHEYIRRFTEAMDKKTGSNLSAIWSAISNPDIKTKEEIDAATDAMDSFRKNLQAAYKKLSTRELGELMLEVQNSQGKGNPVVRGRLGEKTKGKKKEEGDEGGGGEGDE
jgi:hypothetical protein